jgi:hypothetical protein
MGIVLELTGLWLAALGLFLLSLGRGPRAGR